MFGFNIQRQKRYEQILDTFYQLGRKQGEQEGYLMGQIEKTNRESVVPQYLQEAHDIIDRSGF